MVKLQVKDGAGERTIEVLQGGAVLGRAADCDVILQGDLISRRHARIFQEGDAFVVEDLGSSNGTRLNGERVHKERLHTNDRITLGRAEVIFITDRPTDSQIQKELRSGMSTVVGTLDARSPAALAIATLDPQLAAKLNTRLKALHEVSQATCGNLDMERLIEVIGDQAFKALPQAAHVHTVLLGFGEKRTDIRVSMARGQGRCSDAGISRTLLEMATRDMRAVLATDAAQDERFSAAMSIAQQSLRSLMCCPLVVADRVLGAIQVDTTATGRPFTDDDLRLLVAIAGQLAVAAENARLHGEVVAQQRLAAIGEAISSVAHCMKNVLQALEGGSYVVDLGLGKQDMTNVGKGWGIVKRNTDFLGGLVRDMLAYCRKEKPPKTKTDLATLLDETVMMVRDNAAQKGVEASLALTGEAPALEVDAIGLKRAVLNLLTNSVDVCKEGSRVRVLGRLNEALSHYVITVEDNGPGMPEEVRKHLFEPFFTTKGNKGTGLGLALVDKVLKEHRGSVEVESEVGKGTAFHLLLPMPPDAMPPTAVDANGAPRGN